MDNTRLSTNVGVGDLVVTREVSHGGDTAKLPGSFILGISGTEGSYTIAAIDGDAANGLDVDVTRVSGNVTVVNAGTFVVQATCTNAGTFAVQAAQSGTWTVTGAGGTFPVTNAGTFAVQESGGVLTALQIMDDWDSTDRCKVSGLGTTITGTVTRPADTTAYVSGDSLTDVSGNAITFDGCGRINGGTGFIVGATLIDSANQATKPVTELWIFKGSAPPTADADNAVFTPTDAELANLVCIIEFPTAFVGDAQSGAAGNCVIPGRIAGQQGPVRFKCDPANDDLYGLTPIRNAYVPVSSEVFTFLLQVDQD